MTNTTDPVRISIRLTKIRVIKCGGGGELTTCQAETIYTPIRRKRK